MTNYKIQGAFIDRASVHYAASFATLGSKFHFHSSTTCSSRDIEDKDLYNEKHNLSQIATANIIPLYTAMILL